MGADDSADQSGSSRRRRRSDMEEGEFVHGYDASSAGSDAEDHGRYIFQHRRDGIYAEGRAEVKRRRLEGIVVDGHGGALPSPTPSCERDSDSDGTISDIDADDVRAAAIARERSFPCPVCRREFRSQKAKCGHMRVHDLHGRQQGNKERPPVLPLISGGWAVTGKRGSVGGRSVSPESEGEVDYMAIAVAEPVIDAMPMAFARRSGSVETNPTNDNSMAIVVAAEKSPSQNQAVVNPACSPQFVTGHQPAAPQAVVAQGQPAAAALPQIFPGLQPAAQQVQRAVPPARDEQGWWVCKEEGCNQRYATHQGLGGHMAGHKNRQNIEAAAAGLHLGVGEPPKLHPCKHCPRVFTTGVQLGGHMRKHFDGKVIPKKRGAGARPKVSAGEPSTALTLSIPMPPVAMEVAPAQPAVAPAPVVLRLFGFDIVPAPPPATAAEEFPPPAVTETGQSSAASTSNIQQ